MDYSQSLEWLFKQLPMYQRVGKAAYKANLDNTVLLDNHLGNPHLSFATIHVAGTNGKGSTCHMMASVLQEAGYKVGLYTSPHLKDFRERIRINGVMVPKDYVVDFVNKHKLFFESNQLSFFEMTVGMAFQYFKDSNIDIAIIETGLGGRLDSTNIITPLVSVITNIDKDHVAMLGNTLVKIAGEKAGIIKNDVPVVIGERRASLRSLFRESAISKNAIYHQVNHRLKPLETDLKGAYQKDNVRVACEALSVLNQTRDYKILQRHLNSGLLNVVSNTGLRGRYELLQVQPRVIADTAHNKAGIKTLVKQLKLEKFNKLHIVMGMVSDKDVDQVLSLMPKKAFYYIARPNVIRGMEIDVLSGFFKKHQLNYKKFNSVSDALDKAKSLAHSDDLIVVTGSVFVVAEII
ncbi:bifunctional folylpolyglutamate synthase/dihydrofolate synthase [Nonlabens mediterrranea]|uniref:Dihydrofolate synthase/folylpolyglutamate synthase n=1 Tax=Nonlabens mediterrranea TaxID=1419947 RepID=A0ABS0A545_9FLAO|nr:bifunctional folylpolyglutamate synthase/dihydrofolate synthase [Nonlabens mediterrranea]